MVDIVGREWPAIIDTGFNGDLELPDELRLLVNARYLGQQTSLIAGGQVLVEDTYLVDFPFDARNVAADATFAPGTDILIGTHLLRDYRLAIDFVLRTVELERIDVP